MRHRLQKSEFARQEKLVRSLSQEHEESAPAAFFRGDVKEEVAS
jgi:hypothetical protein